jgi:hypothetical protein
MMDFDQEYMKAKMMKSGDQPLDMRLDADGVMRYYLPEEQAVAEEAPAAAPMPSLPEVVVTGQPETFAAPKPAKKKPVAEAKQGQLDLGYATSKFEPAGAMGSLKTVGEMIQSGAEKIDFDVLGFPGIGTLTLKDLTVGDLGKVLVNIAEGMPPVTGSGQTLRPTMESVELINAAPAVTGAVKLAKKAVPKIAESLGPTINKMAEDYLRKTGATMAVAPESVAKQVTDPMPRVDSIQRFPVGPTSIKPKAIAPDAPLYREMDVENLTDFLRNDSQFAYSPAFVTDNPDLAIGQGANKGVKVTFRPNSVSGEENVKPMTGAMTGREYKADVIAPRAIESITFASQADMKKIRPIAANVLKKEFERVTEGNKNIVFVRKAAAKQEKQ